MKASRTDLREKIMIILYQISIYKKEKLDYDVSLIIKDNYEIESEFINSIVFGVLEKENEIDNIINESLNKWSLSRLGETDKAILRLSVYEMKYYNTPNIVCINEAVELSKKYSDDKVTKMINGVLDSLLEKEDNNEK
ncbi:MAG: transcription antitermination factor NusB [Bacilli bacterium]